MHDKQELIDIKIHPAGEEHIEYILDILKPYMKVGKLLPRTKKDILKNLYSNPLITKDTASLPDSNSGLIKSDHSSRSGMHNFFIASFKHNYAGCVAVRDYGNSLFEIRSLAVSEDASGKGVGSALINYAVRIVKNEREGERVFALTRRSDVFIKLGFKVVQMEMFPKKIWFDCSKCKKLDECDEVAVLYKI
jgi:amino-acid N-acetyltransferase